MGFREWLATRAERRRQRNALRAEQRAQKLKVAQEETLRYKTHVDEQNVLHLGEAKPFNINMEKTRKLERREMELAGKREAAEIKREKIAEKRKIIAREELLMRERNAVRGKKERLLRHYLSISPI